MSAGLQITYMTVALIHCAVGTQTIDILVAIYIPHLGTKSLVKDHTWEKSARMIVMLGRLETNPMDGSFPHSALVPVSEQPLSSHKFLASLRH